MPIIIIKRISGISIYMLFFLNYTYNYTNLVLEMGEKLRAESYLKYLIFSCIRNASTQPFNTKFYNPNRQTIGQ